uniref:Headcase middle domain-containing protein n=1 Tax=Syphacia muris TaxID=451379 RepID=A0A0N5AX68_9BILA
MCVIGLPLPENFEDGVKMKCSNSSCKHQEQLIHLECFHALEENLIKIMSNIGSARGWTETQRRSNLWDKKGLTLIQKKCRCPCGLGLMSLDQNAMFLAHVKTKKGKNKNLPKLNFSSGSTIGSSGGKHLSRREKFAY